MALMNVIGVCTKAFMSSMKGFREPTQAFMSLMSGVRAGRKTSMELMSVTGKPPTADMPLMSGVLAASDGGRRGRRRLGGVKKAFMSLMDALKPPPGMGIRGPRGREGAR
jgi:hypothetical protein